MTVYAKRLTPGQRNALETYEGLCGFEPMHQDDLDAGRIAFDELWKRNVKWLEDVLADVSNINPDGFDNDNEPGRGG